MKLNDIIKLLHWSHWTRIVNQANWKTNELNLLQQIFELESSVELRIRIRTANHNHDSDHPRTVFTKWATLQLSSRWSTDSSSIWDMASICHHKFLPLQVVRSQNSPTQGKPPKGSYSRRSFNLPNIIRRALLRTTITQRWEERLDFEWGLR